MDPLAAIKAKQAAGAVLTPLEYAQLNGQQSVGNMLQGQGAPSLATSLNGGDPTATPQSTQNDLNTAFSNLQGLNPPAASVTPAATGASNAPSYLTVQYVNGVPYDMRTSAGQLAFVNATNAKTQKDNATSLANAVSTFKSNIDKTSGEYQQAHAGYEQTGASLKNQAQQYANNWAVQGTNLANSHGTNLAQIGATYSAASPMGYQSSEASDNQFANDNYAAGLAALNRQKELTVGNNYIQGANPDGTLKLGTLGVGDQTDQSSQFGSGYNSNAAQEALAGHNYNQYIGDQNNGLAVAQQGMAQSANSSSDQNENNVARLDGYANMAVPTFGTSNIHSTALPTVDLSKYTQSPLTADAANSGMYANNANFAVPAAVANQSSQSSYLGYAPGSQQNGNLNAFLKAVGTPGY